MRRVMCGMVLAGGGVSAAANAQQARAVPVRDLGPVVASTKETFRFFFGLFQYADGRVLINDAYGRKMALYDSTLTSSTIVADTLASSKIVYGRSPSPFIAFVGDSVLFPDVPSSSILLLGPGGVVARVLAPPKAGDMVWIRQSAVATDTRGRLVYRTQLPPRFGPPGIGPTYADWAPVVRADFETRTTDTVAWLKAPVIKPNTTVAGPDGLLRVVDTLVPFSVIDEWAVHSDGSVAILRGQDYHIDWIAPDGSKSSSAKLPFDWRRLSDEDKTRVADSLLAKYTSMPEVNRAFTFSEAQGMVQQRLNLPLDRFARTTAIDSSQGVPIIYKVVPIEQIPDYVPSIRSGAMKADRDGNLWILPTTSAQSRKGGLVYDIVNRRGEMTDRVELPVGRSIAGFGPKGNVYLMSGDRVKGFTIERARFK